MKKKFMFVAIYLQSDTFDWVQSHLKDLLKNSHIKQEDIINKIFNKFSEVKKHIKTVLKDIDTECTVNKKLISL